MNIPRATPFSTLNGGPGRSLGVLSADFLCESLEKIASSIAPLSDAEIWWRPCEEVNSIGNLLLHLRGNLRQWVVDTLGRESHERQRSEEFSARESATKEQLLADLRGTVEQCIAIARSKGDRVLLEPHRVQGYSVDGLGVLLHVVEHMSYHTGQVVQLCKQLRSGGEPVDFYPHLRRDPESGTDSDRGVLPLPGRGP